MTVSFARRCHHRCRHSQAYTDQFSGAENAEPECGAGRGPHLDSAVFDRDRVCSAVGIDVGELRGARTEEGATREQLSAAERVTSAETAAIMHGARRPRRT